MPAEEDEQRNWVLPDDVVPVRLMTTIWADTDGLHDDFARPADLDAWLDAVGIGQQPARATDGDLTDARLLRNAVRRLAAHVTADERAVSYALDLEAALRAINEMVGWRASPQLHDSGTGLTVAASSVGVHAALGDVANQCIEMLGGGQASRLRACYAPGCVLYFTQTHPRREWCSVACGNRARAARHYRRKVEREARPST